MLYITLEQLNFEKNYILTSSIVYLPELFVALKRMQDLNQHSENAEIPYTHTTVLAVVFLKSNLYLN